VVDPTIQVRRVSKEKRSKGNPHFMSGLRERRKLLLKQLRGTDPDKWEKVIARFAFDHDLRIEKVQEYFTLLKRAGLLTKSEEGKYESI